MSYQFLKNALMDHYKVEDLHMLSMNNRKKKNSQKNLETISHDPTEIKATTRPRTSSRDIPIISVEFVLELQMTES